MHLLILGGSPTTLGGVEAFCERSEHALAQRNSTWRITHLPTDTAFLTVKRLPKLLRSLAGLVRYTHDKPDCVWLQYSNLPDLAFLAVAKLLGLRVMVTPHLGSNWRSQSNPILRSVSGFLLSFSNRLALISKTQESEINLPRKVPRSLIRNFLPESLITGPPPELKAPADLQLIHSGRLSAGKGTFLFVEVCKNLREAGILFSAKITGGADIETYATLKDLIARYDLRENIQVLGRVTEADLLKHLRASDVLIHLSSIDSYPLIVLEALTCSTLPICMELAGARDMIETYDGRVVSVASAASQASEYLLANGVTEIRLRAVQAGQRVRQDYSWDACASKLELALDACVRS